jgi:hypothetical protein
VLQAFLVATVPALPLLTGCSPPKPIAENGASGLAMEEFPFDKTLITKHLPGFDSQAKSQSFFFPIAFGYSHQGKYTRARIQLFSERHAVSGGTPRDETLLRAHWKFLSGEHAQKTVDLLVGENRLLVQSDLEEIRGAANPTRAGLRFIAEQILTPLRESNLGMPDYFPELDAKIQEIVKGF